MSATCCGCHRETHAPIPVRSIERQSGPPVTISACPDCAPRYNPAPTYGEHVRRRGL